ncbi:MAG: DNA-binding protein WhiA [Eubacteriales bacterium]
MSFSANVKQEVCRLPLQKLCCATAELYGVLLFCNTCTVQSIKIVTESQYFAERLPKLLKKSFGFAFDQTPTEGEGGKLTFVLSDGEKISAIFDAYGYAVSNHMTLHVNFGMLEDDCCRVAFLRGAFLAGGSVTDPEKRYHLELTTPHLKVGAEVDALLLDLDFHPKRTERSGNSILYFKQSNYIEDFLTTMGAPICAMKIMEAKVEKDLRNEVNRRVNCETANVFKAVDAAQEQLAAIRILAKDGLDKLPPKLEETAKLRIENPEATLAELAELVEPPVSKSAINHRMRKILAMAKMINN